MRRDQLKTQRENGRRHRRRRERCPSETTSESRTSHTTAEPNVGKAGALRQNRGPRPQNLRTQLESESARGVGKDAGRLLEEVVTSPAVRIPRAQQLMVSSYNS